MRRSRPLRSTRRLGDEAGQATAEFVALVPVLLVCALAALQLALAGWALWSAGTAARAGARAEHVGRNGEEAARKALPGPLRRGAEFDAGPPLRAQVRIPSLIPGLPLFKVAASTTLGSGDG
jgi:hypothetical protein